MNCHEKIVAGTSEVFHSSCSTGNNNNCAFMSKPEENHDLSSIILEPQTNDFTADSCSAAEVSVDYSIDSPKKDGITEKAASNDDIFSVDTTSSCITNQMDVKTELELMRHERDLARDEAIQAQQTLNAVVEAMHILTRQLKKTATSSSSLPTETFTTQDIAETTTTQDNIVDNTSQDLSSNLLGQPDGTTRDELSSALSAGRSIAAYATTDMLRFSEIVRQCSSSSSARTEITKIGSSLIALDDACRSLEQNTKWISDESSMILQDLQQAQAELNELDFRCHRAEKCAKLLYKENLVLKKELEKGKAEKRVLVREIRALIGEKEDREAFQRRLVEGMKAHEEIMIEQTASSSKRNGGVGEVVEGTGEGSNNETENSEKEEIQSRLDTVAIDPPTTPNSKFNPFGKLFQSLSGRMDKLDSNKDSNTLPTTDRSPKLSPTQVSISEESPTFSTILEASKSIGSEYSYDSPVLQLTPTLSSCDSMKSALSASDLNSNDGFEMDQNVIGESKPMNPQRGRKSSTSSWIRQVNATNSSTQKTVISVKLPRKTMSRHPTGLPTNRNFSGNSGNTTGATPRCSLKDRDDKKTKQYRLYTIS